MLFDKREILSKRYKEKMRVIPNIIKLTFPHRSLSEVILKKGLPFVAICCSFLL